MEMTVINRNTAWILVSIMLLAGLLFLSAVPASAGVVYITPSNGGGVFQVLAVTLEGRTCLIALCFFFCYSFSPCQDKRS